jgi:hypothetical protein
VTVPYSKGDVIELGAESLAYETTAFDSKTEPWLDFAGQMTLAVTYPQAVADRLAGCTPQWPETQIGTTTDPNENDAGIFTPNAGQTAQFNDVTTKGFTVLNGSCADYKARFIIVYSCPPASTDAGTPTD